MTETLGERLPGAMKRIERFLGSDQARKVKSEFVHDIMAIYAEVSSQAAEIERLKEAASAPPPPPPPRRMSALAIHLLIHSEQVAREVCKVLRPARNVPYRVGDQDYLTPEEAVVVILRRCVNELIDDGTTA